MSDNNLTRIEIANYINKEIGVSRSESSFFVDSIVNEMIQGLIEKKILKISSFGTLKLRYKKKELEEIQKQELNTLFLLEILYHL